MRAKFIQRPDSVDFTPSQDMSAGEIVRLRNLIGVTKLSIAAGTLGTLSLTGIYDIEKPADVAFSAGEGVYCSSEGKIGKVGVLLGIAITASPAGMELVRILLNCNANQAGTPIEVDAEWQPL